MRLGTVLFTLAFFASLLQARDNSDQLPKVIEKAGPGKVVVLDLDDTIFDLAPRKYRIIKDFASLSSTKATFPQQARIITEKFLLAHMGYHLDASLGSVGVVGAENKKFLEALKAYFDTRFLTDEAVQWDELNPGAKELVEQFIKRGATVVYLSGRDEPGMGKGTRLALRRAGLPVEKPNAVLVLKDDVKKDDAEFKAEARTVIKRLGEVIAVIDNEPANALTIRDKWDIPQAAIFFLNTSWNGSRMDELTRRGDILWLSSLQVPTMKVHD